MAQFVPVIKYPTCEPPTSRRNPQVPELSLKVWNGQVPDSVILPLARGLPAVGRTWIFCQVSVLPPLLLLLLLDVILTVNVVGVTTTGIVPPSGRLLIL